VDEPIAIVASADKTTRDRERIKEPLQQIRSADLRRETGIAQAFQREPALTDVLLFLDRYALVSLD
jgi:hypothetical protein